MTTPEDRTQTPERANYRGIRGSLRWINDNMGQYLSLDSAIRFSIAFAGAGIGVAATNSREGLAAGLIVGMIAGGLTARGAERAKR